MFTKKTSNIGIWGDTGRYPLIFDALKLSVDYFERASCAPEHTLLRKSFEEQKLLKLDWFTNTARIIETYKSGPSKITSANVINNLHNEFKKCWKEQLDNSSKLEFYREIKSSFGREAYLTIRDFSYRSNICMLRTSSHCLEIERGRYNTPKQPRQDRVCQFCLLTNGQILVETEHHAIDVCPLYTIPRNKFKHKINRPIMDVMKNSLNEHELVQLGAFCQTTSDIHEAFREYDKKLYIQKTI